jgi:hypothetical protein
MTYYEDLSYYCYVKRAAERAFVQNIGWLSNRYSFDKFDPPQDLLDALWSFCSVAVYQTRGWHLCELCSSPRWGIPEERAGRRLFLGSAEIRAFSKPGVIYAAPNLIYHYVSVHHYKPPDEFLSALMEGPRPPMPEYFDELEKHGYDWKITCAPDADWDAAMRLRTLRETSGPSE